MLQHLNETPIAPKRVMVIGAGGFVGGAVAARLAVAGVPVLAVGRAEVDLSAADAADTLARLIEPGDAVVAAAARAPAKDEAMVDENLGLANAMVGALTARAGDVAHVVNISSDAVYADEPLPLTEDSPMTPDSHHGKMHVAREALFAREIEAPLAHLRPTLIYGARDPHGGYGPNRFRRLAAQGDDIVLFGNGEERRDHVLIDDVAEIVRLVLFHGSRGTLNVATGDVASFRDIAEMVVGHFEPPVAITGAPRSGPMPHGGYRPFDIAACAAAFPGFAYTPLADGLARVHAEIAREGA